MWSSLVTIGLLAATGSQDPSWPRFRGPEGTGVAAAQVLPLPFGPDENLLWRTELPRGNSSPCVLGERIFLTGYEGERLVMLAVERRSGRILWQADLPFDGDASFSNPSAAPAQPTPCTDGRRVYFYFGAHGVIATDVHGAVQWSRELPGPGTRFGAGSSPILGAGLLFLQRDGAPSWSLDALDPATGKTVWTVRRAAYGPSFSTPFLWRNTQREELVVAGTNTLSSYDPRTGEPLWVVGDLTTLTCTSATADQELLYYAAFSFDRSWVGAHVAPLVEGIDAGEQERSSVALYFDQLDEDKDGRIVPEELPAEYSQAAFTYVDLDKSGAWEIEEYAYIHALPRHRSQNRAIAVRPGGSGVVTDTHVAWSTRRAVPYVASPLLYRGALYLVRSGGVLARFDARTGVLRRWARLGEQGDYFASPVAVGEHLVVCARAGNIFVVSAGEELEVVREVRLEGEIYATPAILDGVLYVRTAGALWAFGR